ncbi:crocetin glucosyltransferase 3-like [Magnolia sinica]|uniref:crocetin glucosyltransferase 3-like n=1 Tax=Magnolia sinica TaxID=86752 RepID=UPI00265B6FF4|nr:crocetin glucosyltransferase 3-like [Magnolia sinica]
MAKHIVMFPYMAQGHLIPFVALAKLIEQRTAHTITIVTTPLNIPTVESSLPPNTSIRLSSLPFNSSEHGLPPNSENTNTLPFTFILKLFEASQTLQPSFESFISDLSQTEGLPLCIIADVFFGWTVEIAQRLGIYHTVFSTCGGYGTAAYFPLWLHLPHTKADSDEFTLPGWPDTIRLHRSQMSWYMRAADGCDPWSVFFRRQLSFSLRSDGMLCNSVEEMEVKGLDLLRRFTGLPVWSVGPLLPPSLLNPSSSSTSSHASTGKEPGISTDRCVEWLNLRRPSSVLYICFGSQNTISAPQMIELAMGLEASGQDFIWVIRPPLGFDINREFRSEWLPEGFEDRITKSKQGILVRRWAPQVEILAHVSTGAFLSHCGWNSVLESLSQGVPMIGWPLASEQFYNSKMMEEEMGVCVEIARGGGMDIERENVKRLIEMVMCGTEGEEMRRKALEFREIIRAAMREEEMEGGRKGSSIAAIDDFIATATATAKKCCGGEND